MEIIGYISIFLLFVVHGIREGFTWADSEERKNNIFICNKIGQGKAKIDYHGWRSIEYLLIILIAITCTRIIPVISVFMMGQLPYNAILHKICTGKYCYIRKNDFSWMGITIPKWTMTWRTDWLFFFIGLTIFLGSL